MSVHWLTASVGARTAESHLQQTGDEKLSFYKLRDYCLQGPPFLMPAGKELSYCLATWPFSFCLFFFSFFSSLSSSYFLNKWSWYSAIFHFAFKNKRWRWRRWQQCRMHRDSLALHFLLFFFSVHFRFNPFFPHFLPNFSFIFCHMSMLHEDVHVSDFK